MAGIGNAYSDEILHAARMSPFALAKSLDREAVGLVYYDVIHSVLGTALRESRRGKPPGLNSRTRSGATCGSTAWAW